MPGESGTERRRRDCQRIGLDGRADGRLRRHRCVLPRRDGSGDVLRRRVRGSPPKARERSTESPGFLVYVGGGFRGREDTKDGGPRMRLPNTAHTSRPWRIHEIARDFRLEDVWALPTPGGPDDFPRLVRQVAAGDPSRSWSGAARALWALRWKVGELLGWDRPVAGGPARRPVRPGLRPVHLALPARRRVRRGDGQPDRPRGHAPRLGPGRGGWLPGTDGGPAQAERTVRRRLHGRDQAVPVRDRLPGADATDRAGVAGGCRQSRRRSRQDWRSWRTATITYQGGTHGDNKRGYEARGGGTAPRLCRDRLPRRYAQPLAQGHHSLLGRRSAHLCRDPLAGHGREPAPESDDRGQRCRPHLAQGVSLQGHRYGTHGGRPVRRSPRVLPRARGRRRDPGRRARGGGAGPAAHIPCLRPGRDRGGGARAVEAPPRGAAQGRARSTHGRVIPSVYTVQLEVGALVGSLAGDPRRSRDAPASTHRTQANA